MHMCSQQDINVIWCLDYHTCERKKENGESLTDEVQVRQFQLKWPAVLTNAFFLFLQLVITKLKSVVKH